MRPETHWKTWLRTTTCTRNQPESWLLPISRPNTYFPHFWSEPRPESKKRKAEGSRYQRPVVYRLLPSNFCFLTKRDRNMQQPSTHLKVLMLAPLWYPIAREAPGGIETFLYQLVGALSRQGCEVKLLAAGDSHSAVGLVPVVERNLYDLMSEGAAWEYIYYEQNQLRLAIEMAPEFDVVHSHIGPGGFVLCAVPGVANRVLHTLHTPVTADMRWLVKKHPCLALTTVSEFQAASIRQAGARCCWVVPNGIDAESFT